MFPSHDPEYTFESLFVVKDQNGDPIDVRIDPTTGQKADVNVYLQRQAQQIRLLAGEGAKVQQQAKQQQKSRTLTKPGNAPKKAKVDPDLAAFDEEAERW